MAGGGAEVAEEELLAAAQESPAERDARLASLFRAFDTAHNGSLSRQQIEAGLQRIAVPHEHKFAQELMEACDQNHDGKCDFHEFQHHMAAKERQLYALFRDIDANFDGALSFSELKQSLEAAGIPTDSAHLQHLMARMDADGNGTISFSEWRDLLLLFPHRASLAQVYQDWEQVCLVDTGEQPCIPEGLSASAGLRQAWSCLAAGAVAGAVSRTASAPFDRIKVVMQCQNADLAPGLSGGAHGGTPLAVPASLQAGLHGGPKGNATVAGPRGGGSSLSRAVRDVWRDGGWRAFFRGNGLNVLKIAPESALKFYLYATFKRVLAPAQPDPAPRNDPAAGTNAQAEVSTAMKLLAGGAAGAAAQAAVYPLDTLKTRVQTHYLSHHVPAAAAGATLQGAALTARTAHAPPSLPALAGSMLQTEGVGAFYRGLGPSLLGIIPYAAIDLTLYETLKSAAASWSPLQQQESGEAPQKAITILPRGPRAPAQVVQLFCGTVSGAVGAMAVFPLQVIRTRMQASLAPSSPDGPRLTMRMVIQDIMRREGVKGFYSGVLPNLLKVASASTISYAVFEQMKKLLDGA